MCWAVDFIRHLFLYSIIASCSCQYIPVQKPNKFSCDESKTSLAEHFFNVIFAEFQSSPPVCVCVQMCVGQPTYCYPNGCLNKNDSKRKNTNERPSAPQDHESGASKTMFIIGEGNDLTHAFHNKADDTRVQRQKSIPREFLGDPLKDMYRTLFKYKKIPSVELRYNLREKVKNMKSDKLKLDTAAVSKRRWPESRHNLLYDNKLYSGGQQVNRQNMAPEKLKIFISKPEEDQRSISSKYFKRDLRRNEYFDKSQTNDIEERVDVIAKRFSIETLIENIIGNNFDEENVSNIEFKVTYNDVNDKVNDSLINFKEKKDTDYLDNNIANIADMIKKWNNYTLNEMIAALSKQIDLQNNTGMDMWKNRTSTKENSMSQTQKPLKKDKTEKTDVLTDSNLVIDQSSPKNTTNE